MTLATAARVLDFWFAPGTELLWFDSTAAFDRTIEREFGSTWEDARAGRLARWQDDAAGCLALVIVLDQFPLNMYRGQALAFSTETQARDVSRFALERGFDRCLAADRQAFLYLPWHHSESLAEQEFAVELFERPGLEDWRKGARQHRDIIARFGRFPHRNAILGRESTRAELDYLASDDAFLG
ncbi:MAG: DUF924 family protein [Gammaproteobacteria bacterium]|nr:DUF924 family protein [Gammaproteobacteria bacterium]